MQLWCGEIHDPVISSLFHFNNVTMSKKNIETHSLPETNVAPESLRFEDVIAFWGLRQRPRIILEKLRSVAAELQPSRVVFVELRTAEPVMACVLVDFC